MNLTCPICNKFLDLLIQLKNNKVSEEEIKSCELDLKKHLEECHK
jgi:hypothetical protein